MARAEYPEPVYSVFGKVAFYVGYETRNGRLLHLRGVNDTKYRIQVTCKIKQTGEETSMILEPFSAPPAVDVPSNYKLLDPWTECTWSGSEVQR